MDTTSEVEPRTPGRGGRHRVFAKIGSLEMLVGAHPDALRDLYEAGTPLAPAKLGETARGQLLAVAPLADAFVATRSIVKLISRQLFPWQGLRFDEGGTSGHNRVLGRDVFAFRCQVESSALDGNPALHLHYDAHGHPWPLSEMVDEVRAVGDGIAIGRTCLKTGAGLVPLIWFGLG